MLDVSLPHSMFSGKDDLYALVRQTRTYINHLETRIKDLEMANTISNPALRVTKPKGRKAK